MLAGELRQRLAKKFRLGNFVQKHFPNTHQRLAPRLLFVRIIQKRLWPWFCNTVCHSINPAEKERQRERVCTTFLAVSQTNNNSIWRQVLRSELCPGRVFVSVVMPFVSQPFKGLRGRTLHQNSKPEFSLRLHSTCACCIAHSSAREGRWIPIHQNVKCYSLPLRRVKSSSTSVP